MTVTTISDIASEDLKSKRVLVRVDLNVPIDKKTGAITDDSRIQAALPTIKYLVEAGARVILVSHLGRPKGEVREDMRLDPVAQRLSELLGQDVAKCNEAVGEEAMRAVAALANGGVLLLENIRFYAGEEANDADFAKALAGLAEIYVNDAFGTAHRAHASTVGVASYLSPAVAGFLMQRELEMLGSKLEKPERPFTAIIGGSKVSSKITVLKELVKKVDVLIIGGGMAFTFLKAQGGSIGQSICEDDHLATAREILALADDNNVAVIIPEDSTVTAARDESGVIDVFERYGRDDEITTEVINAKSIPDDKQGMDIGHAAAAKFAELIGQSRTVVWNGPVGVFEYSAFERGTKIVAKALAELTEKGGTSIIGGGDSVAAIEKFGISKDSYTHVSTGGGASLEFLEGKTLPGVAALETKETIMG